MMITNILIIMFLIILTGFFVAIEFSIVKVRPSRIDELIMEGRKGSTLAKRITTHLDEYLSACQLGITVTSLGLGWLGEPTAEQLLRPLFIHLHFNDSITHILSFGFAFILVTFLEVVMGELAPKTIAIQKAEAITMALAVPIIWFSKLMFPFIWVLNQSSRVLASIMGFNPNNVQDEAHSEEELRLLMAESYERGEINQSELKYVNNIFKFDERIAKEIMVPRPEISSVSVEDSLEEVIRKVEEEQYTRYPVIEGDKDNILGIVNVKELLMAKIRNHILPRDFSIKPFIHPIIHVIETIPIHDLLVKMQKERIHLAILMDEYGGTSGLVTVEDIIEEIVGEVRDEFDVDEVPDIRKIKEGQYVLDAKLLIEDVNQLLGISLPDEEVKTIGGWFLTRNMDAEAGAEAEAEGYIFKVQEVDGYHLLYLKVKKTEEEEQTVVNNP